jgi:hypothetical protein
MEITMEIKEISNAILEITTEMRISLIGTKQILLTTTREETDLMTMVIITKELVVLLVENKKQILIVSNKLAVPMNLLIAKEWICIIVIWKWRHNIILINLKWKRAQLRKKNPMK